MKSNKKVVRKLIEICAAKGIEYVIISPGSRNAPLNISFNEDERFKCISVPDERVAGFIALGIAQQTQKPALITCTSGTAALNYAPAIAEAYFQKIMVYHFLDDKSPKSAASALKVNPFFVSQYQTAAKNYNKRQLFYIFEYLKEYDHKSKGVNNKSTDQSGLLKELIFKILHA